MANNNSTGYPVQIASFKKNKLFFNISSFNEIIDKVGMRKLSIFSINGPMRSGKSYMLGHFLRFLSSSNEDDWFNKKLKSEFHWINASKRQTTGILMWSEPFFLQKNDEEIAVLLMDTQGCFDDQTTTHENSLIFSLSCLLSSTLIYNVSKQLTEDILQFLQMFVGFAKLTEDSDEPQSFSKLIFLIRDWQCPKEYNYGYYDESTTAGPNNFLSDKLDLKPNMIPEVRIVREEIISSFQDIGCCLMPHPGEELAINDDITELNPRFIRTVKDFITRAFDNNNIITKKICGQEINGQLFKQFVERWAEYYEKNEIPVVKSVNESTAEVQNQIACNISQKIYRSEMEKLLKNSDGLSDEDFEAYHKKNMEEAILVFKRMKRLKNEDIQRRYLKVLEETIQQSFDAYQQTNFTKRKFQEYKVETEKVQNLMRVEMDKQAQEAIERQQKMEMELEKQAQDANLKQEQLKLAIEKQEQESILRQQQLKEELDNQARDAEKRQNQLKTEMDKKSNETAEMKQKLEKEMKEQKEEAEQRQKTLQMEMEKKAQESKERQEKLNLELEKSCKNAEEIQKQMKKNKKQLKQQNEEREKKLQLEMEKKTKEAEETFRLLKAELQQTNEAELKNQQLRMEMEKKELEVRLKMEKELESKLREAEDMKNQMKMNMDLQAREADVKQQQKEMEIKLREIQAEAKQELLKIQLEKQLKDIQNRLAEQKGCIIS